MHSLVLSWAERTGVLGLRWWERGFNGAVEVFFWRLVSWLLLLAGLMVVALPIIAVVVLSA